MKTKIKGDGEGGVWIFNFRPENFKVFSHNPKKTLVNNMYMYIANTKEKDDYIYNSEARLVRWSDKRTLTNIEY